MNSLHGVVAVVTGGGKTVFAEHCIAGFWEKYPRGQALVVVPTLALLDQWYVAASEDLSLNETEIGTYSGRGRATEPRRLNLLVLNTARHQVVGLSRRADSLLVVDECHRAATDQNSLALEGFYKATLGLSATPERQYDEGFEKYIEPRLGQIIYRYTYRDALEDGVITPFRLVNVAVTLTPAEQSEWDTLTARLVRAGGTDNEESDEIRKRLLIARARIAANAEMRIPVAVKIVEQNRGERVIVFHESIAHAERIAQSLNAAGIRTTLYHSRLNDVSRRENLRLFRRGLFDVLVTCRALDEGLNVPDVRVAVVASSTASTRQRIQRLGRVLRPAPGKAEAVVFTLYGTEPEEKRLVRETQDMQGLASVHWQRAARRSG
jgi:superfamily II DNA or RNA helicase